MWFSHSKWRLKKIEKKRKARLNLCILAPNEDTLEGTIQACCMMCVCNFRLKAREDTRESLKVISQLLSNWIMSSRFSEMPCLKNSKNTQWRLIGEGTKHWTLSSISTYTHTDLMHLHTQTCTYTSEKNKTCKWTNNGRTYMQMPTAVLAEIIENYWADEPLGSL